MSTAFHADANDKRRYSLATKLGLRSAISMLVIGISTWYGYTPSPMGWWILGALALLNGFVFYSTYQRRRWGDAVAVQSDAIVVTRDGQVQHRIAGIAISHFLLKNDCAVIQWHKESGKEAVVIGGESFAEPTWQALHAALQGFDAERLAAKPAPQAN